jgi:hypothetical protein
MWSYILAYCVFNDRCRFCHGTGRRTQPTLTVAEMVRADERLKNEFPLITRACPQRERCCARGGQPTGRGGQWVDQLDSPRN